MNPENPTTALVKTAQSPALARVSNQLALTDKLLTKPEEPFLIPYRKGDKWGFCDRDKNIVIDCVYKRVWPFEGLHAVAVLDDTYGLINRWGHFIDKGEQVGYSYDGVVSSTIKRKDIKQTHIYDRNQAALPKNCDLYIKFDNGDSDPQLFAVRRLSKWGFVNKAGEEIIPFIYDEVLPFSENFAGVAINVSKDERKWGFIDKCGLYLKIYSKNGSNYWGYQVGQSGEFNINNNGKEMFYFDKVGSFSEGLATIMQLDINSPNNLNNRGAERWGFVKNDGVLLFEESHYSGQQYYPPYEVVSSFNNGIAYVMDHDGDNSGYYETSVWNGYIDKMGDRYFEGTWPLDHKLM